MPSTTHEALLLLFRHRPELAPELLRDALRVELPAWSEARIEAADLSEIVPTEYRADLVVLRVDGRPVLAVIVEAQLSKSSAALVGCADLDSDRMELHLDLVAFSLNDAARTAFEELMGSGTYEYQTEFVKKLAARRAEERAQNLAEGRAEGHAEARASDVVIILETRGVAVSKEEKARILSCRDPQTLDRWIRLAVTARSAADLFDG